jgi:FkbM family methyltransferase
MSFEETIIKTPGANWKHNFLNKLGHYKEFPTRLRIFNTFRKFWGLDILKFKTPSGLQLSLDITDWVQSQIYFSGNYEGKSVELFKRLSADAPVIFDIGSHVGQYALECAQIDISLSKQIFAIEVNPKTFTYLLNNIQINKFSNIKAVLGAVSSKSDILNINIPAYWNMGNTQINEAVENTGFDNYLAASFDILTLLKKYGLQKIDLIKIDVEGHEFDVLSGLFQHNIFPPNIIFEHIPDIFTRCADLINLLKHAGYIIKDIDGNNYTDSKKVPEQNLWAQKI